MRLDIERQKSLEPKRINYAIEQLSEQGYTVVRGGKKDLRFAHKGHIITFFPYSGFYSGRSIKAGRGLLNLLKQLKENV